jgi:prepilin-type N-terminal cleavage/methylation domain-containing protein
MKRTSRDAGTEASAWIADDGGFTLIELLVAMVVSLIVIGGGVYGIAQAFKQNTQVTDRLITSSSAEVGIQRFTLDLRYALNGSPPNPSCVIGSIKVPGVQVTMPTTGVYTVAMCEQNGALSSSVSGTSTYASLASAPQAVIWACNTTGSPAAVTVPISVNVPAETCTRTLGVTPGTRFHGITALTLTGLVNGANISLFSSTATYCTQTGGTTCNYSLSANLPNSLASVSISAQLADLKNPLNQADTTTVQTAKPISLQTTAELRNFGT